jgi:hypothetical protein
VPGPDLGAFLLFLTCKPKNEPHIRAVLSQHTGGEVILSGMDTTRTDDGERAEQRADFAARSAASLVTWPLRHIRAEKPVTVSHRSGRRSGRRRASPVRVMW